MPTPKLPDAAYTHELVAGNIKAAQKATGATSGQVFYVPYAEITLLSGFNVRMDTPDYLEHIEALKASIRENGYFPNKPLGGYVGVEADKQSFVLTDGYSRYRALGELIAEGVPIDPIPFMPKSAGTSLEDLTVALVQDNEGRALTVLEKAVVAKRLSGYGMDNLTIAKRLGKTDRYVADLLLLSGASAPIRSAIISGRMSATEAVKQLRKGAGAEKRVTAAVEGAAATGKKKATGKDVAKAVAKGAAPAGKAKPASKAKPVAAAPAPAAPLPGVTTTTVRYTSGTILPVDDEFRSVARLGGGDWWAWNDEATKTDVMIEDSVMFEITVTRAAPAAAAPAEEDDTFAPAPETSQDAPEAAAGTQAPATPEDAATAHLETVSDPAVAPATDDDEL